METHEDYGRPVFGAPEGESALDLPADVQKLRQDLMKLAELEDWGRLLEPLVGSPEWEAFEKAVKTKSDEWLAMAGRELLSAGESGVSPFRAGYLQGWQAGLRAAAEMPRVAAGRAKRARNAFERKHPEFGAPQDLLDD